MNPYLSLLVAFLLLAANAFYVAAEFALVKARGFRIDALADEQKFGAVLTKKMLANIEAYLACCQLGITMASLGLGWVGEPTVAAIVTPLLHPLGMSDEAIHLISFAIGFLVFSSLHIVIGEQVPKTFAIRNPEPVTLLIAYPLYWSFLIFYPLKLGPQRRLARRAARVRRQRSLAPRSADRRRDRKHRRRLRRAGRPRYKHA
jgi:CBS domain containing-hemolysin-like protein